MEIVNTIFNDYEYDYLKEIQQTCRISLFLGVKGSGKTTLALNIFKLIYLNQLVNGYMQFHMVLPSFKNEQKDSYKFIKDCKKFKNVYIYDAFNEGVVDYVYNLSKKNKGNDKTFFLIDDATGDFAKAFYGQSIFSKFVSESRHIRINTVVIAHHLTGVLKPMYRSLFDFIFLFKISNAKLLKSMYEEFLSLRDEYRKYETFKLQYNEFMKSNKYSYMFVDMINHTNEFMKNNDWTINLLNDVKDLDNNI